jgi:oligosaccharide repeat unit polymerase
MAGLYAFTSLLGIIVVLGDLLDDGGILFDNYDIQFSPIATLLYCGLITWGILPFSMLYKKDLKIITTPNPTIVLALSIFLIIIAFINLYLVADSTVEILSGDLSTIRTDHYNGIESPAQVKAQSMPFVIKFLYYFNTSTLLAIPLFFYYLCFSKKPWWFKGLLLFTSLSMPIAGIQTADRTEMVFYAMMFLSCLILFHKFLSAKIKRIMRYLTIPIALAMIVYFGAVTEARFSKRESGTVGNLAQYAGQNYLNFCYFWEKANYDHITAERELPMTYHYVFKIDNDDYRRSIRSGQQGFFMSVFASYIGDIMLDLSPIGMIAWCTFFFLIMTIILKRPHREELSVGEYMVYFVFSAIPIFGIFYYRYMSFPYTFMLITVALVYFTDKYDFYFSLPQEKEQTNI